VGNKGGGARRQGEREVGRRIGMNETGKITGNLKRKQLLIGNLWPVTGQRRQSVVGEGEGGGGGGG
jgi:hypothetical protein